MYENIIGNNEIKKYLIQASETGKISHSYLFIGTEGIGKKLFAKELAKSILCLNKEKNLICNNCKSCIEFESNNNPDFYIITPEENSIKIEQIRQLQKKASEKPIISQNKVYIIDESDKMTKEAQNSLLKTLEEPPEYVTIILIAQNENAILSTIKSRCTIIHFKPIINEEIKKFLENNYKLENIEENILNSFQGSIGKAIRLKDKKEELDIIYNIINEIEKKDIIDLMKMAEILYKEKENIQDILEYINTILIEKAKTSYLYAECIEIVEETKKRLKSNANYDMTIDNMIFSIKEKIS